MFKVSVFPRQFARRQADGVGSGFEQLAANLLFLRTHLPQALRKGQGLQIVHVLACFFLHFFQRLENVIRFLGGVGHLLRARWRVLLRDCMAPAASFICFCASSCIFCAVWLHCRMVSAGNIGFFMRFLHGPLRLLA